VSEEIITVCGVHRDTVELLDKIREEMARNTVAITKVTTTFSWLKWAITGVLGATFTLMIAVIPFIANLHARILVLEKWEKAKYETVERRNIQSITNDAKSGILPDNKAVDVGIPLGIR